MIMTIDSLFVRKCRTSRNKMRHSQLKEQRHLEAGGKNEGEEMSEGISPAQRRSLRDGKADDKNPRTTSAADCDKKVDFTSNLEPGGR